MFGTDGLQTGLAILRAEDLDALVFQVFQGLFDQQADVGFVVDD